MTSPARRLYLVDRAAYRSYDIKRMWALPASVFGACQVGAAYAVSIMLHCIQQTYGVSTQTLTLLGSVGFVFQFFTLPAGVILDRRGPTLGIAIPTAVTCLGWLLFCFVFTGAIPPSTINLMVLLVILVCTTGWNDPCINVPALHRWPNNTGMVILVVKVFMGLSATILALTFSCLFAPATESHSADSSNNNSNNNNNSHHHHNSTKINPHKVVEYNVMFCCMAAFWGVMAVIFVDEPPSLKAMRQKTYFAKREIENENENENEDDLLMPRAVEAQVHKISESIILPYDETESNQSTSNKNGNNESPHLRLLQLLRAEHQRGVALHQSDINSITAVPDALRVDSDEEDPLANAAVQAALNFHTIFDPTLLVCAQSLLVANLVYLSAASITLLLLPESPSFPIRVAIAAVAHVLLLSFLLLPLLRQFVVAPSCGYAVLLPASATTSATDNIDDVNNNDNNDRNNDRNNLQISLPNPDQRGDEEEGSQQRQENIHNNSNNDDDDERVILRDERGEEEEEEDGLPSSPSQVCPEHPYDDTFWEALTCRSSSGPDLWLLLLSVSSVFGGGAVIISNGVLMYNALATDAVENKNNSDHHRPHGGPLCVALIGVGSALGRVVVGAVEPLLTRCRRPMSLLLFLSPLLLLVAAALGLAIRNKNALFIPFFVAGFAYGSSWSILLLMSKQIWVRDVGQKYMFCFLSGISVIPFGRFVLGPTYEAERHEQGAAQGKCAGVACVAPTLIWLGSACVVCTVAAIAVHWRFMRRNSLSFFGAIPAAGGVARRSAEWNVLENEEGEN